ncbi:MAG: methyltransferase domain-containing protein [Thermodesulfobacteriota bacterium]
MKDEMWHSRSRRISEAFSQAAQAYDSGASLQRAVATELLEHAAALKISPTMIVEIGCGTGFLTGGLKRFFPKVTIAGCDIAHSMTAIAADQVDGSAFHPVTADGSALPFKNAAFNLAASSLAYQWFTDLTLAFSEIYRVLAPGGVLTCSLLGEDTFKELNTAYRAAAKSARRDGLPPLMTFPSRSQLLSALKSAGFKRPSLTGSARLRFYDDLFSLIRAVRGIGASNPSTGGDRSLARGALLKDMSRLYREMFSATPQRGEDGGKNTHPAKDGSNTAERQIYATYDIIFCTAVKD